jgi:hypothetical protein
MMVDLPAPEEPTKAVCLPCSSTRLTSLSEGFLPFMYLNETFLKTISPEIVSIGLDPSLSRLIFGS